MDTDDARKLEAFHVRCQRQLLRVSWRDHMTNAEITDRTRLTSLKEQLSSRRASLFGHISRLDTTVPAHLALWLQTDITIGRKPDASWRRTPGRPRKTWISQIQEDVHMSARSYWDASTRRGHGRMTQRSFMTTRSWWWWIFVIPPSGTHRGTFFVASRCWSVFCLCVPKSNCLAVTLPQVVWCTSSKDQKCSSFGADSLVAPCSVVFLI